MMTPDQQQLLRSLPAISDLLERDEVKAWLAKTPRALVIEALQAAVSRVRGELLRGTSTPVDPTSIIELAKEHAAHRSLPSLRRVINATGVVLHTGLGRAPLCREAVEAVAACAGNYSNLEMDLDSGTRGRRVSHVVSLLCEITGAESATVVNNNAGATLLVLSTFARGLEVIVSRGQLVEIGGSYRLPDVMTASGARLREVGTTNRTRAGDYEKAITPDTAALLHVHTSNYKLIGFTESVSIEELVALGRSHGKLVLDDLGSGAIFDLAEIGLPGEPNARASLAAGADLVFFSGDKLLGGPQAGIIVGRAELIRQVEANPLMRTYRVGKMTLAALEATLRQYRDRDHAARTIPSLALLAASPDDLQKRAHHLLAQMREQLPGHDLSIVTDVSVAGGGSLPGWEVETHCVAWRPATLSVDDALARLRACDPPVVARASNDSVLFDARTITDAEVPMIASLAAGCLPDAAE